MRDFFTYLVDRYLDNGFRSQIVDGSGQLLVPGNLGSQTPDSRLHGVRVHQTPVGGTGWARL
jgi:hypothetical protein